MQHHLEFDGQTRILGPGVLTIGAGREAGWRVEHKSLERIHAMFIVERDARVLLTRGDEVAWVELNGHPVTTPSIEVKPGDEVRMAEAVFRLVAGVPHGAGEEGAGYLRDVKRDRWYRLGDRTAIGRDLACHVLILDPDISRTHAEVVREGMGFVVHPRRGVTLVNTRRATEPAALEEGDEVTVGQTTLRFGTTPPPRGANAPGRVSATLREVAGMQTTFMSPLAVREGFRRRRQRRTGTIVAGVCVVAAVVALMVTAGLEAGRGVVSVASPPMDTATLADSAMVPPATMPAPAADPGLPDSVARIEAGPMVEEPITAGATTRPRP